MSQPSQFNVDPQAIANCFRTLHSPTSSPMARKEANQRLLQLQSTPVQLLAKLLQIFQGSEEEGLRLQALVYFCNILKRSWLLRRYNKAHSDFQALKKDIRNKVIQYLGARERPFLKTLFDMARFIVEKDYPHNFPAFTQFSLAMLGELDLSPIAVLVTKQLKETFFEIGERKGTIGKKLFQENLRPILNACCQLSIRLKDAVLATVGDGTLTSPLAKMSKYSDQIVLYILRAAPTDIMDEAFSRQAVEFLSGKLQALLSSHAGCSQAMAPLLEKNIKSLIFDLGLLQLSKPLLLSWILPQLFPVLIYVIQHPQTFAKSEPIRYSLIGLRRIIKEFAYYSQEVAFNCAIKSKVTSANCLQLRRKCAEFYWNTFTPQAVEQLLNYMLFNPFARGRGDGCCLDPEEAAGVERGREKELGVGACVVMLLEALLERFTVQTHALVTGLLCNCLQNNWNNLDASSTGNLLSVVALLPGTCKRGERQALSSVPILQVLQFIYSRPSYHRQFAAIVSGWLDGFDNSQLDSLVGVLLDFIGRSAQRGVEEGLEQGLELPMSCCQCLNKIVSQRGAAIDLKSLAQQVLPVGLRLMEAVDAPEVLWPMVTLLSSVMIKVEFDGRTIVGAVEPARLGGLVNTQSPMLIQALCEMFKSFLCVIPRETPARSVFQLVCLFLNGHLSDLGSVSHQKIFHLWYIAIREYSPIHQCQPLYQQLFQNHFKKNLYRKTPTLVYILQEYLLAGLAPVGVQDCVAVAQESYLQAEGMQKQEKVNLKVAALSFQITLMTLFPIEKTNSDRLLRAILQDLGNFDPQAVSPTVRNSILSIFNRYIALHLQDFLEYLASLGVGFLDFLEAYVRSMDSLTSNTATKINAIAVTSLLNRIDKTLLLPHLHHLLRLTIPQVQRHLSSLQSGISGAIFIGKVDNSPSLRFASNTLSTRKEQTRRMDAFDKVDLASAWRRELGQFLVRAGVTTGQVAEAFGDQAWAERFMRLL